MNDPHYPSEQPKDAVSSALTDRNADPDALVQDAPLKVHGDALLGAKPSPAGESAGESADGPPDGSRDEGF